MLAGAVRHAAWRRTAAGPDPLRRAEKSEEHVELLQLDKSGIRVTKYLTELPPREVLEKTLHDSIVVARERLVVAERDT